MASQIPLPDPLTEQVRTWAAETYLPPKDRWLAEGKSEQGWFDTLALMRVCIDCDPAA
jgi:hypothetical protein